MTTDPLPPLGATEVFDLRSVAVGDTCRVFLGHCGDHPESALLVTDANGQFGLTVDMVRLMQIPALVSPMLVVGVGYLDADGVVDTVENRARDLTPGHDPRFPASGGADAFTDFLVRELRPLLRDRFGGCADDVTYFGHSFGGLLGAQLLVTSPGAFSRYFLSSPSLWWDDRLVLRLEHAWAEAHDDLGASVYLGIGSDETGAGRRIEASALPDGHRFKPPPAHLDMVDDLARFVAALDGRGYPSLSMEHAVFPDEFHATVPALVLTHALRSFALG
jgi:predicted alpha/beta superfamily hydrolase